MPKVGGEPAEDDFLEERVELEVRRDEEARRFVTSVDGGEAYLAWAGAGEESTVDYRSTYVPPPARGRGVGTRLVLAALEDARDRGWRVVPTCPFVADVVQRHPEYAEILTR